jgi:hypothetical protein
MRKKFRVEKKEIAKKIEEENKPKNFALKLENLREEDEVFNIKENYNYHIIIEYLHF